MCILPYDGADCGECYCVSYLTMEQTVVSAIAARASRTATASVPAPMATTGALTLSEVEMPSVGVAFGVVILSVAIVTDILGPTFVVGVASVAIVTDRPGPNIVVGGVSVVAMVLVVVGVACDNDCSSDNDDCSLGNGRSGEVTSGDVRGEDVMATDGVGVGTSSQMTPASREWLHSLSPQPDRPHSASLLWLP